MREEQFRMAGGAESNVGDVFRRNASIDELLAVGLSQIEEYFFGQLAVPWRLCSQEQQRIFFVDIICLFGLPKERIRVTKLRFKL